MTEKMIYDTRKGISAKRRTKTIVHDLKTIYLSISTHTQMRDMIRGLICKHSLNGFTSEIFLS